jgi:NADPH-dependent glutamate synthase beta subunit-like oxidoreductase
MQPTDTSQPDYFHKVVDCQWACPAHTDVPEYIRLIAQGRFTDAYMVNRHSNVFPGILGRVCDRPCEPACRRGRVEEKPVAICRLKRVAADHRDEDIRARLPKVPKLKNGKKVALIGAGCASLTVANDLMPLGYSVTIFEQWGVAGGLMRTNIPSFRLPAEVLNDEIAQIVEMGVDLKLNHPVKSMKELLTKGGFDAVFVGAGAPKGKELKLPGRAEGAANIHIGITWLESVAFEHIKSHWREGADHRCRQHRDGLLPHVSAPGREGRESHGAQASPVLQGLGLGARRRRRRTRQDHHQSFAEKLRARERQARGMTFDVIEYDLDAKGAITAERVVSEEFIEADDVILAIGQENAFPWIERDLGIEFDKWDVPKVDLKTFQSTRDGVFFGGDAAFGPKNIIWAVEHGHQAAISIHNHCQKKPVTERLPPGVNLHSTKMGMHEWAYANDYNPAERRLMPHVSLKERFKKLNIEVELGFTVEQIEKEVQRCLNCDVQTVFETKLCIECDAVHRHLSGGLPDDHDERRGSRPSYALKAPAKNVTQALYVSSALKHTGRVMVKDEDLCVHCGLCAERCPTAAWDMQKSTIQWPHATDEAAATQPNFPKSA